MTPTQRALKAFRAAGYTCQVVERWNAFARVRQDLFGCIDIVGMGEAGIVGIQATSLSNVKARMKKSEAEPRMLQWLDCGGRFCVVGYGPKGGSMVERIEKAMLEKGTITWISETRTIGKARLKAGKGVRRKTSK